MVYDYDALYSGQPDALGDQTPEFARFFGKLTPPLRVLDVGCGQGRDALPLARAGFEVVGIDLSPAGVEQMVKAGEGLSLTAVAADIRDYRPEGVFDVVLIDRTLHMLEDNEQSEVLGGLLSHVAPGGHLLIADEKSNMPRLRAVLAASDRAWEVIKDKRGYLFAQVEEAT